MCGISGIVGSENVCPELLDSIRNLEYRGYDSCGMAILRSHRIEVKKNTGTVDEVNEREGFSEFVGSLGIAHTRWATHGGVTRGNAHPHTNGAQNIALVHNGIISNYRELREQLRKQKYKFLSETDTETIVHLVDQYYSQEKDLESAFVKALKRLEGSFAVALISTYEPGKIYCAKRESPLIVGLGTDCNYVASDFNAFIQYTKNAVVLEDGEYAVVTKNDYLVRKIATGKPVAKTVTQIHWDGEMSKKDGYPDYMLKEIYEQPQSIRNVLQIDGEEIRRAARTIHESSRVFLLGAGTTFYVSLLAEYYFSSLAGMFAPAISSDEFSHLAQVDGDTVVVAVSQSGETYDTIQALKHSKERGAKTIAVVNVFGSTISRMADQAIMQGTGPEICVISTKAALAQMIVLLRIVIETAYFRKRIDAKTRQRHYKTIEKLPDLIQQVLNEKSGFLNSVAQDYSAICNWMYLGRGRYYPIALEAALKMKEVAYVHAEGMPGGFLKHGTIALIDERHYSVVFVPPEKEKELYQATMGSAEEVLARNGFVLGFHFSEKLKRDKFFSREIFLPKTDPLIAPFLHLIAGQLLAYFTAVTLKRNVDRPRSLAKSVTVA